MEELEAWEDPQTPESNHVGQLFQFSPKMEAQTESKKLMFLSFFPFNR